MGFISSLLNMDFAALVPELDKVLKFIHIALTVAVLAGPIIMSILGVIYLFFAPPEANYKLGYRTYFGMGSVEAWQFTQRIAGMIFGGLGIVLTIVMIFVVAKFPGKDAFQMADAAFVALIWQLVLVLLARGGIAFWTAFYFTADGSRREHKKN